MNQETLVLRVGIDGRWEASEFAASLTALDRVYKVRFALTLELEELDELGLRYTGLPSPPFPYSLRELRRLAKRFPRPFLHVERTPLFTADEGAASDLLEPQERLVVRRVLYGSPGFKDLIGIGEIVGHVKELLLRIIEHWSTARQRELENEGRVWRTRRSALR